MSAAAAPAAIRPRGLPARSISNAVLWVAVFLGGFVFIEPAPYDLLLAAVIPLWFLLGLRVPRAIAPLVTLMLLFLAGGVLALSQAVHLGTDPKPLLYVAISAFLTISACFFAAVASDGPDRLDAIVSAWVWTGLATAALGMLGYVGLTGELFVRYGRATGGFQDPNVFGPFLVFPFLILMRRALTRRLGGALLSGALALFLAAAIFLSFSRSAWGMTVITAVFLGVVLFAMERRPLERARYIGLAAVGAICISVLIAGALSLPAVSKLFAQRAQIIQTYDGGHLGRFERYGIGFNMMIDSPLGIGPMEFGKIFREDEHDIWLKALTSYGWLGFGALLTLVIWTLVAAFPLVFRTGPAQPVAQAAYAVFAGHFLIATVIDIDHWRHVYLLFGVLWAMIALDRRQAQNRLAARHPAEAGRAFAGSQMPA